MSDFPYPESTGSSTCKTVARKTKTGAQRVEGSKEHTQRKTSKLLVRVTPDEHETLRLLAQQAGVTISDYVRVAVFSARFVMAQRDDAGDPVGEDSAKNEKSIVLIEPGAIEDVYRELNHWGRNYNQGVRALNSIRRKYQAKGGSKEIESILTLADVSRRYLERAYKGINNVVERVDALEKKAALSMRLRRPRGEGVDENA